MNPYSPPSKPPTDDAPPESNDKRSPLREALAVGFMVIGALALVYALFPWINPTQYRMNSTGGESLLIRTLVGVAAAVPPLWAAFHFNKRSKSTTRRKQ